VKLNFPQKQKIQFSEVMLCNSLHLHLQGQSVQNKQLHWEVRLSIRGIYEGRKKGNVCAIIGLP